MKVTPRDSRPNEQRVGTLIFYDRKLSSLLKALSVGVDHISCEICTYGIAVHMIIYCEQGIHECGQTIRVCTSCRDAAVEAILYEMCKVDPALPDEPTSL
jgi:hypothetical protein